MKFNKLAIAVGAAVLGLSSVAQAEISANIGVTSNYIWRGVTQTNDGAAIQGGIDYAHESGFYAGTWASNVEWVNGEELDLYAGFAGEVEGFGYDVGAIYYMYPSDGTDSDFTEIYGSVSFGPATAGLAYTIDKEATSTDVNDLYYYLSAGTDIADGWSVSGTVGHYDFEAAGGDYSHAQLDVTKSAGDFGDFTFSLSKAGDNSGDDGINPFVSWSKSF